MKKDFSRKKYIRIISFLLFLSVILGVSTFTNAVRADRYHTMALLSSQRAISELCENLDNITVTLQKGLYAGSDEMLSDVGSELCRSAACAKVSLSQLTQENMITDEIYKFLSQVGDFTVAIGKLSADGQKLSENQVKQLRQLYEYSQSLSQGMGTVRAGCYDGTVSLERSSDVLLPESGQETAFYADSVNDTEQSLADYPTLVYDGPFADSQLDRDAPMLKNESEVTADEARKTAATYLGVKPSELRRDSDENSGVALFCFSKSGKSVGITKKGGYLCYITNPDYSQAVVISEKEAVKRASEFLENIGYKNMKESYYSTYDGVCTINFAWTKDGVVYYSDLIKVSVALDSARVVAVDARSYLMNHCSRSLPKTKISRDEAEDLLAAGLKLLDTKEAVIPTKYGKERLCYEMHCTDGEQEVLIYIDEETGSEAEILLLLYADGGVLTK